MTYDCRKITKTNIPSMQRESRGIILICKKTRRILCIDRKSSPEFLHLMRGFYRRENIRSDIIPNCTQEEHDMLKEICYETDRKTRYNKIYNFLSDRYDRNKVDRCIKTTMSNFDEDMDELKSALLQIMPRETKNSMWPKGGMNRGETEVQCAIRETLEETGVIVPAEKVTRNQLLVESTSFFGVMFRTVYFIAYTDEEYSLTDNYDKNEVSAVKWIHVDDLEKHVVPDYSKIIPDIRNYCNN